jgi:hypothetical protein
MANGLDKLYPLDGFDIEEEFPEVVHAKALEVYARNPLHMANVVVCISYCEKRKEIFEQKIKRRRSKADEQLHEEKHQELRKVQANEEALAKLCERVEVAAAKFDAVRPYNREREACAHILQGHEFLSQLQQEGRVFRWIAVSLRRKLHQQLRIKPGSGWRLLSHITYGRLGFACFRGNCSIQTNPAFELALRWLNGRPGT